MIDFCKLVNLICLLHRQHGDVTAGRELPTVDCSLVSSTRPHSPDSLEPTQNQSQSQSQAHVHSIPRTHLKRDRMGEKNGKGPTGRTLVPSDVTEL